MPCGFCGCRDSDGHLFWDCTFPPLVEIREHPEFHDLLEMDKTSWLRCLLWHGWLPLLSGVNGGSPWAQTLLRELLIFLSVLLGCILLVRFLSGGCLLVLMLRVRLEGLLRNLMFGLMVVWLMTRFLVFLLAGAGCFTFRVRRLWACWNWGHWDDDVGDGSVVSACRGFLSVPGASADFSEGRPLGCYSLQVNDDVHLGVDNLVVVRHVGRILDGKLSSRPFGVIAGTVIFFFLLKECCAFVG